MTVQNPKTDSVVEWIDSLNKDIISVVIPTFNRPEFLIMQLTSLAITYSADKLEIIVVSDGGDCERNDNIIKNSHLNIKHIYYPENSGTVCIPRNIGISHISGRTIAPVDDDVICSTNKFNVLYEALWDKDNPDTIMSYGDRITVMNNTMRVVSAANQNPKEVGLDNGQFIYKADVYKYIKPVFSINACDWYTYSSFADFGKFSYVNQTVCIYHWHGNNISLIPESKRLKPLSVLPKYLQYFKDGPFKNECIRILDNQNTN